MKMLISLHKNCVRIVSNTIKFIDYKIYRYFQRLPDIKGHICLKCSQLFFPKLYYEISILLSVVLTMISLIFFHSLSLSIYIYIYIYICEPKGKRQIGIFLLKSLILDYSQLVSILNNQHEKKGFVEKGILSWLAGCLDFMAHQLF